MRSGVAIIVTALTSLGNGAVANRAMCATAPTATRNLDNFEAMNLTLSLAPLVSLVAGVLILIVPRLLNYIVAIYLIVIGLLGLVGAGSFHLK